jgi:hypothetical protein
VIVQLSTERLPLADESVDLVFSDPPYVGDQIHTYRWLANEAARVLRPGRFVAAMCGGNRLNEIMRWFDDAGLQFWWLYQLGLMGQGTGIVWRHGNHNVPISTRTKHVLVYSRGYALSRTATVGLYWAGGADKRWHHWGQDIDSHRYYIDCLSAPGDLVLDPMCGGGTTAEACQILGRRFICGDIYAPTLAVASRRLRSVTPGFEDCPLFEAVG